MTLKIGAITKLGLFFPVVCFIHVFDQTLAEQLYRDKVLFNYSSELDTNTSNANRQTKNHSHTRRRQNTLKPVNHPESLSGKQHVSLWNISANNILSVKYSRISVSIRNIRVHTAVATI